MEKQGENSNAQEKPEKNETPTKNLLGFLEWYKDATASPREKRLLKQSIDAAFDERREVVEKEFNKMVDEDPNLRAAFESLPAEMTATTPQLEIAGLANELRKSPEQFEKYIQWLDAIGQTIGFSIDKSEDFTKIKNALYAIGKAEREKSLETNTKDVIAMKIFFIRQMKKCLRQYGIAADALTDEAFQKWLQSKKIRGTGDNRPYEFD